MTHGWNSKEVQIDRFYVDGWAMVDGRQIIFEYNGCAFHSCERCKTIRRPKNEDERKEFFKNLPNSHVVSISGCEWHEQKFEIDFQSYTPRISPLLFKDNLAGPQFIKYILEESINGFMVVDISRTADAQKWMDVNWPPLFQKDEISYADLPEWMQPLYEENDFPKETIVQKMNAKKILLHTKFIKFYLQNGFTIDKIHKFYEYEGAKCFKNVFTKVYRARVEATEAKDEMKATAVKLVSNSMYGQLLLVSVINLHILHQFDVNLINFIINFIINVT